MSVPTTLHINEAMDQQTLSFVKEYYSSCKVEPIGPYNDMSVGAPKGFYTFEELLTNMLNSSTGYHLIVSHGSDAQGLIMALTSDSSFVETGLVIEDLSTLADTVGKSTDTKYLGLSEPVKNLQATLGLASSAPVMNLAETLVKLRKKKPVVSFRACNVGKNTALLRSYQSAFAAPRVMAPTCPNGFLQINPGGKNSIARLNQLGQAELKNTKKNRVRFFPRNGFPDNPPGSDVGPIVIEARERNPYDYPTTTWVHDPQRIHLWAERLNRSWTGPTDKFVMSVMWDDSLSTFHCPAELGYTRKLAVVS